MFTKLKECTKTKGFKKAVKYSKVAGGVALAVAIIPFATDSVDDIVDTVHNIIDCAKEIRS